MELSKLVVAAKQQVNEEEERETNDNFWSQMMAECQANCPNKLSSSKSLLVLGDDDAQKTQLIAKLQGSGEKLRKGNGLQYHFLTVRDEYCENQTKLDIWLLDDDPSFQNLLRYVLSENTISDTTVLLTASMAKPWDILSSVCTWTEILETHIKNANISNTVLDERKSKVLKRYQEYVEPTMSIYGTLDEQSNFAQIENNIGLEIIVVITQTEYMTTLQSEYGFIEEHFDFIQFSLRKFCLSYGAALLYVSVKEDRNCDILLKYILHKIYSLPFRIPAMFLEKDSIFVPAGWDSENKILTLAETLATIAFSSPFEEVIVKPGRLVERNRILLEVEAQNDQDFLIGLQASVQRPLPDNSADLNRDSSSASGTVSSRNPQRRIPRAPRSPQKKQLETKIASGEGDTVLQSFFKSLLKRQTSAPAERPVGTRGYMTGNVTTSDIGSTSLDNIASAHSKGNLGTRKLGASVDSSETKEGKSLTAVDELNPTDDFNSKLQRELRKMEKEQNMDPFTDFIKKYNAQGKSGKEASTPHNSVDPGPDDDDANVHQLPEYFMSSQTSSHCPSDCCFPNNAQTSNGNYELTDMDKSLDRVQSKYNPPLRLLLETSHDAPVKQPASLIKKCSVDYQQLPLKKDSQNSIITPVSLDKQDIGDTGGPSSSKYANSEDSSLCYADKNKTENTGNC